MKYLIIQLCDSSVSFCHYKAKCKTNLISLQSHETGLIWAVKRGLDIQILYPKYTLPDRYLNILSKYPHVKIASEETKDCDVVILENWTSIYGVEDICVLPVVLQTTYKDFIVHHHKLCLYLHKFNRLNIVFTDASELVDNNILEYENALKSLSDVILCLFKEGRMIQLNLITDRMLLSKMNNCDAVVEHITLAPDGKFYPCPAFYLENSNNIGNLIDGLHIPNEHLYQLVYAPICRICDAYNCKRCVWLNKKLTLEINTPSRQQCLMAHVERSVAGQLLDRIREFGDYVQDIQIPKLKYLDPFEKLLNENL